MSEAEKGNGTKILFTILFAIAFTGFMVFVLTSDMFIVRSIEVKNTTKLDIDKIKKAGYDPTVMMIVLNSKDFLEVLPVVNKKDEKKDVTTSSNVIVLA